MTPKIIHLSQEEISARITELREHFRMSDQELNDRADNYLLSLDEQADFEEIQDLKFLLSA